MPTTTTTITRWRTTTLPLALTLAGSLTLAACDINFKSSGAKQDTTVVAASPDSARVAAARDSARSAAVGGVPAVPGDSAAALAAASGADSGALQIYPTQPRRGGVLFAFAPGLATASPRCTWKGEPLPCYRVGGGGVLATVPLPADDPAGTYTLTVDRPAGRITRQVTVADKDFGRELVFLDPPHYALLRRGADVARDARAVRGVLTAETPDRQWSGRWKEPLPSGRSTNYGVDRFYYPATDSSRAISLGTGMRTRGAFGTDTTDYDAAAAKPGDVPGWRHAGIDIPAVRGAAVLAPAAGTVAEVGSYVLTGNTLLVDHGQGVFSAYFHLDTVLVRKGDRVRVGRTLARVGATGLATGPHLHYGLYLHGRDVDPNAWRDMPPFALGDSTSLAARR
ncbi:MAG TPA: M23 family metallopeptidase [Gemmatimonadaceae bacterium]|nr:M23 family metallopeptidase [Gemmatimonadaceae bacterium]